MKTWDKFFEAFDDVDNTSIIQNITDSLSEKNIGLKKGCIDLLVKSMGDEASELGNVQNFIDGYLEETETLEGFIESSDIFDFYLKFQTDIDSLLDDDGFFNEVPKTNNVYSLYDYVIEGTKIAVAKAMETIKDEIV